MSDAGSIEVTETIEIRLPEAGSWYLVRLTKEQALNVRDLLNGQFPVEATIE